MTDETSPTPDAVRAWFAGAVTDADLARYVGLLRADPQWLVAMSAQPRAYILVLSYRPTGEDLDILLRRDDPGGRWRPDPRPSP